MGTSQKDVLAGQKQEEEEEKVPGNDNQPENELHFEDNDPLQELSQDLKHIYHSEEFGTQAENPGITENMQIQELISR